MVFPEIAKYLKEFEKTLNFNDLWFSGYGNKPAELDLPIGLLYDREVKDGIWELTASAKDYPPALIKYQGETPMLDLYLAMLKEADYLRNSTVIKSMSMPANDQNKLWQSITNGNHDNFWDVMDGMLEGEWKLFPIRIYHQDKLIRRKFQLTGIIN